MKRRFLLPAALLLVLALLAVSVQAGSVPSADSGDTMPAADSASLLSEEDGDGIVYYDSLETIGAALRVALKNHAESCTLGYTGGEQITGEQIWNEALKHTGVPDEGDYLKTIVSDGAWYEQPGSRESLMISYPYSADTYEVEGNTVFSFGNLVYRTTLEQEEKVTARLNILAESLIQNCYDNTIHSLFSFVNEIPYGAGEDDSGHTAYGALMNRLAVCEGRSALFYRLALMCGISNRIVFGAASEDFSASDEGHAWNRVYAPGSDAWYTIDTTWGLYMGQYTEEYVFAPGANESGFEELYPIARKKYTLNIPHTFEESSGTLCITMSGAMPDEQRREGITVTEDGLLILIEWTDEIRNKTKHIVFSGNVTSIGKGCFQNFTNLESVILPDNLRDIKENAFCGCEKLTGIILPENVTSIGNGAFGGTSISSINLPNGLKSIGDGAFSGTELIKVMIPDSVETIGSEAFRGCFLLSTVSFGEGSRLSQIGEYAFASTSIKTIILPEGLAEIPKGLFKDCHELAELPPLDHVSVIGEEAFQRCAIIDASIPEGVITIGNYAFEGCNLKSIVFPESLEYIGDGVFSDHFMESVFIPANVSHIGKNAFSLIRDSFSVDLRNQYYTSVDGILYTKDMKELLIVPSTNAAFGNTLSIPEGTETIKADTIHAYITTLRIPSTLTAGLSSSLFSKYDYLESIEVSENNPVYSSEDGVLFNKDKTELLFYPSRKGADSYRIPDTVKRIGERAFRICHVKEVIIPEGVIEIDDYAFELCDVEEIVLPDTLHVLGAGVFMSSQIASLSTGSGLTDINSAICWNCMNIRTVYIGHSVKQIDCFTNADVSNIAFYYYGTQEEWEEIQFISNEFPQSSISVDNITFLGVHSVQEEGKILVSLDANGGSVAVSSIKGNYLDAYGELPVPEREGYTFCGWFTDSQKGVPVTAETTLHVTRNHTLYAHWTDTVEMSGSAGTDGNILWALHDDGTLVLYGYGATPNTNIEPWAFYEERQRIQQVIISGEIQELGYASLTGFNHASSVSFEAPVTEIGASCFSVWTSLENIVIPEGVTAIHKYTFWMSGIKSVVLPHTLIIIEDEAFGDNTEGWVNGACSSLESIEIPESVTYIGSSAFEKCAALTTVIDHSHSSKSVNAFSGCTSLREVVVDDGTTLRLDGNAAIERVEIHGGVISDYAFAGCVNLRTVILSNITGIGNNVFSGCRALENIIIPDTVTAIGDYAFSGCDHLQSLTLPNSIRRAGAGMLQDCTSLQSFTYHGMMKTIPDYFLMGCTGLTEVTLNDTLVSIGNAAFSDCNALETVYWNGSKEKWGGVSIAQNNEPLTDGAQIEFLEVEVPVTLNANGGMIDSEGIIRIYGNCYGPLPEPVYEGRVFLGWYTALNGGVSVTDTTLVTNSGAHTLYAHWLTPYSAGTCGSDIEWMLWDNGTLEISGEGELFFTDAPWAEYARSIVRVLTAGIQTLPENAFAGYRSLRSVELGSGLTTIGNSAFKNCTMLNGIKFPDTLQSIGAYCFEQCTSLHGEITVPDSVTFIGNDAFSYTAIESAVLPDNLEIVPQGIFYSCRSLSGIHLPNNCVSIGEYAFYMCALTDVIIPDTVRNIERCAFMSCGSLENITLPEHLDSMGSEVFRDCKSLKRITVPDGISVLNGSTFMRCDSLAEVKLPNGLTEIGNNAFSYCPALEAIVIPATVNTLANCSFVDCSSLKTIVFQSNVAFHTYGTPSHFSGVTATAFYPDQSECEEPYWNENTMLDYGGNLTWQSYVSLGTSPLHEHSYTEQEEIKGCLHCTLCTCECGFSYRKDVTYTHTEVCEEGVEATCTGYGMSGRVYCSSCGWTLAPAEPLESLGHNEVIDEGVAAGCTTPGLTAGSHCDRCGIAIIEQTEMPATGHSWGEWETYENPTEKTAGRQKRVCSICSECEFNCIPSSGTVDCGILTSSICWELNSDGVLTVFGNGAMPDTYKTEKIVNGTVYVNQDESIPWFAYNDMITSIVVEPGITHIGTYLFSSTMVESVSLPETVTSIAGYAFRWCSKLKSISLPSGITSIGDYTFGSCSSLPLIRIPSGVTNIGAGAFTFCRGLTTMDIPNSVSDIGTAAFANCTGLTEIHLPSSLEAISEEMLCNCSNLKDIQIPLGVTSIGRSAFWQCVSLKNIVFPDSVKSIGEYAFNGVTGLENIIFGSGIEHIGQQVLVSETAYLFYSGSETQWSNVLIEDYICKNGSIHFNSTGDHGQETIIPSVEPTCMESGLTEGTCCAVCGMTYKEQEPIPALGHDLIHHEKQEPTYSHAGWLEYDTCSRCDYTTYQEIPATNNPIYIIFEGEPVIWYGVTDGKNTLQLRAELEREYLEQGGEVPTTIEWQSSDTNVVSFNGEGIATAIGCGTAQVFAVGRLSNGDIIYSGKLDITVKAPFQLSDTQVWMILDESREYQLSVVAWDDSVTNRDLIWTVEDNPDIIVDQNGLVTVLRGTVGNVVVTNGDGYFAKCKIVGWQYVHEITFDPIKIQPGESINLLNYIHVLPKDTNYYGISSTSTNPDAFRVDDYWFITGVNEGTGTLIVTETVTGLEFSTTITVCEHDNVTIEYQEPTCTVLGHTMGRYCRKCGYVEYESETIPVLGHDLIHHEAQAASCTEIGWEAYDTCSRCDYTTYVELLALDHDLIHHEAQAASCTEIGWEAYDTCSRCDYTTYVELPALDHDLIHHEAQAASCTEIGWNAYDTCSRCDYTTYVELSALDHNLIHHEAQAASCTEIGWEAYDTCSRCDYTTYVELSALDHDLIHHEAKAATCTDIGWDEYDTCSRCEYSTYAEIPAVDHDLIHHEAQPATCTEIGWEAYDTCSRCDYTTYVELLALDHDLIHHEAKAATCTDIGWNEYDTCSRCEYSTYAEIPALDHDLIHHEAQPATCTEIGWEAYDTCSRCDYTTYVELSALDHDLIHHEAQPATCTEIGWEAYDTCSRCDYTTYEEIAALGHDLIHHEAQAASCTEIGWYAYDTCSRCDYTTYVELSALDHDLIHHEAKAATCTDIGWNEYDTCSRCEYTTYEEIAALGHTEVADAAAPATCTETGLTAGSHCDVCGETLVAQEVTPMLEHEFGEDHICIVCGAIDPLYSLNRGTCGEELYWMLDNDGRLVISGTGDMTDYTENEKAPWNPEKVLSVVLEENVTGIGDYAFCDCVNLEEVTIPKTVTRIGSYAFSGCKKLTSASFPGSLKSIGAHAFDGCSGLTGLTLPASITSVGQEAFASCPNIAKVMVPYEETVVPKYNDAKVFGSYLYYRIHYELNGGNQNAKNTTLYLKRLGTPLYNPTRTGYTFKGWYLEPGFTTKVTEIAAGTSGAKTLYAKWAVKNFAITYELNGGKQNAKNPETYTVESETITLAKPSRTGYTFGGWYFEPEFATKVTEIAAGSTGAKKLYAKWTAVNYKVIYELNGGTQNAGNPATYTVNDPLFTLKKPTRTGYTFNGWYKEKTFATKVTAIAGGTTGKVTLYAKWTPKNYALTYELDGGTNNAANPATYIIENTVTLKNATKKGYSFKGWYLEPAFETKVTEIAAGTTGALTLYAKFAIVNYNVVYELNGGTQNADNPATYTVNDALFTLKNPTRTGYTFNGWYKEETFKTKVTEIAGGTTGKVTLYAKWTAKKYDITYVLKNGTQNAKNPVTYTIAGAALYNPTKKGYTFKGWYLDEALTEKVAEIAAGTTGALTLYAKWSVKTYTITYELNGGKNKADNPASYKVTTALFTLLKPTKTGYTFKGWYLEPEFKTKVTEIGGGATGNLTLYAKWAKKA